MLDNYSYSFKWGQRGGDWLLFVVAFLGLFAFLGTSSFGEPESATACMAKFYNNGNISSFNFWQEGKNIIFTGYQHWMLLLSKFSGVEEWIFRLPSVLAALITLLATVRTSRWLFGREESRCAGWLLIGSYGFLFWGKIATSEMISMAFFMTAIWFFFTFRSWMKYHNWLIFFSISIGAPLFGSMSGGFWSFLLPLLITWPFIRQRYMRNMFLALLTVVAVLGLLLFTLFRESLEEWIVLFFATYGYSYTSIIGPFSDLLLIAFPWTLLNLAALVEIIFCYHMFPRRLRKFSSGMVWLFLGVIILGADNQGRWLIFLPLIQIFTGAVLCFEANEDFWNRINLIMRFLVIIFGSMAIVSLLLLPYWHKLFRFSPPWQFLVILPIIGLITILIMIYDENYRLQLAYWSGLPIHCSAILLAGAIFMVGIAGVLYPIISSKRALPAFAIVHGSPTSTNRIFWKTPPSKTLSFYLNSSHKESVVSTANELKKYINTPRLEIWLQSQLELASLEEALNSLGVVIDVNNPTYKEEKLLWESNRLDKVQVWVIESTSIGETI